MMREAAFAQCKAISSQLSARANLFKADGGNETKAF